ncbi:hypothetical protein QBC46DRAFT_436301 [Diplogelasinospora grovesii]|uniref:Uncharacterized protein n=1 Tax=Diplogelasinospora grovesii TaxID=303347 RepID=A0AAN6N6G5_9PEZI|nr:hypothetical protein QBC46DRAFT_436301 [Diplogelasinospora grovesii]
MSVPESTYRPRSTVGGSPPPSPTTASPPEPTATAAATAAASPQDDASFEPEAIMFPVWPWDIPPATIDTTKLVTWTQHVYFPSHAKSPILEKVVYTTGRRPVTSTITRWSAVTKPPHSTISTIVPWDQRDDPHKWPVIPTLTTVTVPVPAAAPTPTPVIAARRDAEAGPIYPLVVVPTVTYPAAAAPTNPLARVEEAQRVNFAGPWEKWDIASMTVLACFFGMFVVLMLYDAWEKYLNRDRKSFKNWLLRRDEPEPL